MLYLSLLSQITWRRLSMANEETPTKEQMNSDKDQTAAVHELAERKDPPDPIETITSRPRQERRRPSYLRDYVEK